MKPLSETYIFAITCLDVDCFQVLIQKARENDITLNSERKSLSILSMTYALLKNAEHVSQSFDAVYNSSN